MKRMITFILMVLSIAALFPASAGAAGTAAPLTGWNVKKIDLPSYDAVYDSSRDTMLVTVKSKHTSLGNMLVEVDPRTGQVGRRLYVGSSPRRLAITDDFSAVFIVLEGANRVARVNLSTFTLTDTFTTGLGQYGPAIVGDIDTVPGRNDTVLVTLGDSDSSAHMGIWAFRDGQPLPNNTGKDEPSSFIEVSGPSTVLGFNRNSTEFGLRTNRLDDSGVTFQSMAKTPITGFDEDIEYADGILYSTNGYAIDAATSQTVHEFGAEGLIEPTPENNRITFFFRGVVSVFDTRTGQFLESRYLPQLPEWGYSLVASAEGFVLTAFDGLYLLGPSASGKAVLLPAGPATRLAGMQAKALPVESHHMVNDPLRNRLYLSLPTPSREILSLDADTGQELGRLDLGETPGALAINDDSTRLFATTVVSCASGSVKTVDLETFRVISTVALEPATSWKFESLRATDVEAVPGRTDSFAVAVEASCTAFKPQGVAIYDSGERRTQVMSSTLQSGGPETLNFAGSNKLFGYAYGKFLEMDVDSNGVRLVDTMTRNLPFWWGDDIKVKGNRTYQTQGTVLDSESGMRIGRLDAWEYLSSSVAPSGLELHPSEDRAYLLRPVADDPTRQSAYYLEEYDTTTFRYVGSILVPVSYEGAAIAPNPGPTVKTRNGFAIAGNNLVILSSSGPLAPPPPLPDAALAWGWNAYGQVGVASQNPGILNSPSALGLRDATQVTAGYLHSIALLEDGTVWAWGWNGLGSIGDGTTVDRKVPVKVANLSNVVAIASGWFHNLAVKSDGTVWAWGWNPLGQLGTGNTAQQNTPVQVPNLNGVTAVSAGAYHSLARKSDGSVLAWGWNGFGQLGDGTLTDRLVPKAIRGLENAASVSGGTYHSLATTNTGGVLAWGWNGFGQLGDGTLNNRRSPTTVKNLAGVTQVSAGLGHSLAVDQNGKGFSWGWNALGQLGDGTTTDKRLPGPLPGGTPKLTQVSAGFLHSLAVAGGGIAAWGWDDYGQRGDGAVAIPITAPIVTPGGPTNVRWVSAGVFHSLAGREY